MEKKSREEIINETVEYYSADPTRRAKNAISCVYFDHDTGNMCGVGRCMKDPAAIAKDQSQAWRGIIGLMGELGQEILKEEYQGHSKVFWQGIQSLHDDEDNWNQEGITEKGREMVQRLMKHAKFD